MISKLLPESPVSCVALSAVKLPVIVRMPSRAIWSVAPVAMAMLPEKVEQAASADASPALWRVVVAALLHEDCAIIAISPHLLSYSCASSFTHRLPGLQRPAPARDTSRRPLCEFAIRITATEWVSRVMRW